MNAGITLVTATVMEMQAVLRGIGLTAPAPERGESATVLWRDTPLHLVCSGIGPLAAAFVMGRLAGEGALSQTRCRGVISLGIAGTYAQEIAPIGAVVVADSTIWPEYGLLTENGMDAEALGFPLAGKKDDVAPPPVWDTLPLDPALSFAAMRLTDPVAVPQTAGAPVVVTGGSVTVAGVSGTLARAGELAGRYGALIENMESFPLALSAAQWGLPFVEIRSVSNLVGDRRPEAWNIPASLAALSHVAGVVFAGEPATGDDAVRYCKKPV